MNYIKIFGFHFKLRGKTIKVGDKLHFRAVNRHQQEVYLHDFKGPKVISLIPNIKTHVCDLQTQQIAKLAQLHSHIHFISISTDSVTKINKWCLARGIHNLKIWSDEYNDFALKTNLFITRLKKIPRGFIVLDQKNKIINMKINKKITKSIDFNALESLLTKID